MSTKPTGPGRGGDAVEIVFTAISCQSRTASARAICDPPNAVNAKRGRMVKPSSNLFERMRYMGSSLSARAAMPPLLGLFGNRSDGRPDSYARTIRATTYVFAFGLRTKG